MIDLIIEMTLTLYWTISGDPFLKEAFLRKQIQFSIALEMC